MFKLVALLFLVTNGVQAEKPFGAMKHKQTFASSEACESYLKESGEKDKKLIVEMAASEDVKVGDLVCIKDATEDNKI